MENNLEKLLQKIAADEDLSELGELDNKTKEILKRMADGEIEADRAIETFLETKTKL